MVATGQTVRPVGDLLKITSRPVDLALSPDGRTLFIKDHRGVLVADADTMQLQQSIALSGGTSMHGITAAPDGRTVYVTDAAGALHELAREDSGRWGEVRAVPLPAVSVKGASYPCGLSLSPNGGRALVCLGRDNSVAEVDLDSAKIVRRFSVGTAPYAVLWVDETTAWVTNWGGRRPLPSDKTADSSGSPVVVDARGVAATGTVSRLDLRSGTAETGISVGLHPSHMVLDRMRGRLYIANANSDSVSVVDTTARRVTATWSVRPDAGLMFGSMPNALALSEKGDRLLVALGGNNAVAVLNTSSGRLEGLIPSGWFPTGLSLRGSVLHIASAKGLGSRGVPASAGRRSVYAYTGVVQRTAMPDAEQLIQWTQQAREDANVPQLLMKQEAAAEASARVPVPTLPGQKSLFRHVVYIIKENRTYDQVLGDLPQADGDPKLCLFPEEVTPNHHALAREFVLLDNFYCNGVLSADGHSWSTEGSVTDHLEKSFGGFSRSYTFGDDPLTYSSSGFVWDRVLAKGLSFRNYGEFDYAATVKKAGWKEIFEDWKSGAGRIARTQKIGVERLRQYTSPQYPGWNMDIPDVLRASVFLKELAEFEKQGRFPNFSTIYLPNDHTSGTRPGSPTPRAQVADNDLALGRIVSAITRSRFWKETCIFVIEDDPQDGFDHVDGHRSLCLVISPYTRRGAVVKEFYNQTSVLRTMLAMLGCEPLGQMTGQSPLMTSCFSGRMDAAPYSVRPNRVPLDEMNPSLSTLPAKGRKLAEMSAALPLAKPDMADEETLNRILWGAVNPHKPYPAMWAGAHGRGLKSRGLALGASRRPDD